MKGLGRRIQELRKQRKLTLVEVAKKTGIDQATLSRIENGVMTGTLESHMKISDVLGINLPTLYEDVISKTNELKEKVARQKIETFSHSSGAVSEILTANLLKKKMMPMLLKLKAGGRTETEELPALTEKFAYVLKGTVELSVGSGKHTLKTGESFYWDASQPYHFKNSSKSESWVLSMTTPVSL